MPNPPPRRAGGAFVSWPQIFGRWGPQITPCPLPPPPWPCREHNGRNPRCATPRGQGMCDPFPAPKGMPAQVWKGPDRRSVISSPSERFGKKRGCHAIPQKANPHRPVPCPVTPPPSTPCPLRLPPLPPNCTASPLPPPSPHHTPSPQHTPSDFVWLDRRTPGA